MKALTVLCLVAVALPLVLGGSTDCILNCVQDVSNCLQGGGGCTTEGCVCNCIGNYANCLDGCSDWCTYAGDYYESWYGPYCGASQAYPCYNELCDIFDGCDGNGGGGGGGGSNNYQYFFEMVVCYYFDLVCGIEELIVALTEASNGAVVQALETTCDAYDNYCEDVPDLFKKRGASTARSISVRFVDFANQAEADAALNAVVASVNAGLNIPGGGIVAAVAESTCNDCGNECNDCPLNGKWYREDSGDCTDFNGCTESPGDVDIKIRSWLTFDGKDASGKDQDLAIKQKWEFSGDVFGVSTPSIDCEVTYGGEFRFYSDAVTCSNRISLDNIDTCDHNCDNSILSDDLKAMLCENFPVTNGLQDVSFADKCKTATIQGLDYEASASQFVPIAALLAVVAALNLF